MSDLLDVTKSQARILRAISYLEKQQNKKGVTEYDCLINIPKEIRIPKTTFNENIMQLKKNMLVLRLKKSPKTKRKTKPYTITDFGQIAWLRYNVLTTNTEILYKIFPDIQFFLIDDIINQIKHPAMKIIKNSYSKMILKRALDSFHIENSKLPTAEYMQKYVRETIELTEYYELVKISFRRYYKMRDPARPKQIRKEVGSFLEFERNFDDLEISIMDKMTFLFYYKLIQSVMQPVYVSEVIFNAISKPTKKETEDVLDISIIISKKKKEITKEIMKKINANETVTKIIQDNLNYLSKYKGTNFQDISDMFIKTSNS